MELVVSKNKGVPIANGMMGLFFEDINYGADGGLYAEMIENRSFESYDCFGDVGDYYVKKDSGYGWSPANLPGTPGAGQMEYVMGSPVNSNNPHYLRFTAAFAGQGFRNQAYDGIYMEAGKEYKVSFYARCAKYQGNLLVSVFKGGHARASASVACQHAAEKSWNKWIRYEAVLVSEEPVKAGQFMITLTKPGIVEFDLISMMPSDAAAGVFRKDLFDILKDMKPGFIRFPGGCVIEGNTLENRYRWKESVGPIEGRRANYNRWSVHGACAENGYHTDHSHYNQTLGIGFYEYFLLCELLGAAPLPVLNAGLACQFQSYELVDREEEAFQEYIQDALDLIEFANGGVDTRWGGLRAKMGHPESFGLTMLSIGNEQWQTDKVDFFERCVDFEKAIHERYPEIKLIGSAGPDITTEKYTRAWAFYHEKCAENRDFCYAVDEHYYVRPDWFYEHTDFYDKYPRDVKVFSGEYAAHPEGNFTGVLTGNDANTLEAALAEAAFLTGVERNADVVILASYAPLFARVGHNQWQPDMIWFDAERAFGTPSYYVQKMYCENMGTVTVPMEGQEAVLREHGIYANISLDENTGAYIFKVINANVEAFTLELKDADGAALRKNVSVEVLTGDSTAYNSIECPKKIVPEKMEMELDGVFCFAPNSFTVIRMAG